MPNAHLPRKPCERCGREIVWRKKWERSWGEVRYCSEACKRGVSGEGAAMEGAIMELLAGRKKGATICPSEAARKALGERWREGMEEARRAARRLVVAGKVEITEGKGGGGKVVDPSRARGAIRVRGV